MQFLIVLLLLLILPPASRAQSYTLKENEMKEYFSGENTEQAQLYHVITLKEGWASTGRAVPANGEAFGIVVISHKGITTSHTLKAGYQCRFYSIVADSDSSLVTGGLIIHEKDGERKGLLVRWDLQGRLLDSVSFRIEDKRWAMMNDLLPGPDKKIYGICMVMENGQSSPYLCCFDQRLELVYTKLLPGISLSTGLVARMAANEEADALYLAINQEKTTLLLKTDLRGNVTEEEKVEIPYSDYRREKNDTSRPDHSLQPELFHLQLHKGRLYVSGTSGSSACVAIYDSSLRLQASSVIRGGFDESGGKILFRNNECWLSTLTYAGNGKEQLNLYRLDDSLLTVKDMLSSRRTALMQFATVLSDGSLLFCGQSDRKGLKIAASCRLLPAEEKTVSNYNPRWTSLQGPPGADATALAIDKKGNYWLGTGSSGGVYYSDDKGKSWSPKLEGMGPLHVSDLVWREDTLFADVLDMRPIENKDADKYGSSRYLYRTKKKGGWKIFSDRSRFEELGRYLQEEGIRRFNIYNERFPLKKTSVTYSRLIEYYKSWGIDFKNEGFDIYKHEVSNRFGSFYPLDSNLLRLNRRFPADVFEKQRNLEMDGERMILLAKSGLYFSDNGIDLEPAPVKGLIATDVRLLREGPNGDLYALVGTHEIWKRSGNQWTVLFDANDHLMEYGKDTVETGYDIPVFDLNSKGEVIFPYGGDAWMVDSAGRARLLKPHGDWIRDKYGEKRNVNIFGATLMPDGRAYFLGSSIDNNSFRLYVPKGDELDTLIDTKSLVFPFFYSDKAGRTWLLADSIYLLEATGPKAMIDRPSGTRYITQVSSNHKGNLVVMKNNGCIIWDPVTDEWIPRNWQPPKVEGTTDDNSFSSVAIDEEGTIYTGTAPWYVISCGFSTEGNPSGLYRLNGYNFTPMKNPINSWIFSLECDKSGKLLVGTAGSGVISTR